MREIDRNRARTAKQRLDTFMQLLRQRKAGLLDDEKKHLTIARRALAKMMQRHEAL